MKPIEECRTVAELLEAPERWCRGAPARNSSGNSVPPTSHLAVCWCLSWAVYKVYWNNGFEVKRKVLSDALASDPSAGGVNVPSWNDAELRKHADVLALVGKAGI